MLKFKSINRNTLLISKLHKNVMISSRSITHLVSLNQLSVPQIENLIFQAIEYKYQLNKSKDKSNYTDLLKGSSIAMLFEKRSTRTRVATETSANLLGARSLFLSSQDIQLNVNESLYDTTKVLSSMVDCIVARVDSHDTIKALVKDSSVPIINALCDKYHPTQILADIMTLYEHYIKVQGKDVRDKVSISEVLKGKKMVWLGDGNNVLNSLVLTVPRFKMHFSVVTPQDYQLDTAIVEEAKSLADKSSEIQIFQQPKQALKQGDVVVTDTWVSMGQEQEFQKRIQDFNGFQITKKLLTESGMNKDYVFLHCLPRKPYEVDDEVFYSKESLVFQEAENRKWTIMAVLKALLVDKQFK